MLQPRVIAAGNVREVAERIQSLDVLNDIGYLDHIQLAAETAISVLAKEIQDTWRQLGELNLLGAVPSQEELYAQAHQMATVARPSLMTGIIGRGKEEVEWGRKEKLYMEQRRIAELVLEMQKYAYILHTLLQHPVVKRVVRPGIEVIEDGLQIGFGYEQQQKLATCDEPYPV